jgi:flagellin-like hook-associated protein FlgL
MDAIFQGLNNLNGLASQMTAQGNDVSKTLQRLSSGVRIANASDDAAGLSLSTQSSNESRLYTQALSNINEAISLTNIASDALETLGSLASAMQELANQAASSSLTSEQRATLNEESQQLRSEFERVQSTTEYNGIALLPTAPTNISVQAGITSSSNFNISFGGDAAAIDFETTVTEITYDGTMRAATTISGGTQQQDIEIADINGDGNADIMTTGEVGTSRNVRVHLGNGNGTFAAVSSYSLGASANPSAFDLEVGDFDGDTIKDIVVSSYGTDREISFLKGNSNGTFQAAIASATGLSADFGMSIAKGDFDEDGDLDLLIGSNNVPYTVNILLNNGSGSFTSGALVGSGVLGGIGAPSVGDFNSDGNLDFVGSDDTPQINLFLGNGNATFSSVALPFATGVPRSLMSGDLDGDGDLDVVSPNGGDLSVFLGNDDGTFTARTDYSVPVGVSNMELLDITGDSILDIIGNDNTTLFTYVGNGNGTFGALKSVATTGSTGLAAADLDSDGYADAVSLTNSSGLRIHLTGDPQTTTGPFSISTVAGAQAATTMLDGVLEYIDLEKGKNAAARSRLEVSYTNADAMRSNLADASATIREIDVAEELASYTAAQVRSQITSALFAHAQGNPSELMNLILP